MDRPKLQDCKFFLEGSCKKGFSCPFRHSEEAKNTNKPCFKWLKQQCASESCPYRHEALHAEGSQQQAKPHPKPRPQQQPSPFDIMLKKQQKQQKKQQQQQQQPSPFDMLKKQQKQQKKQQQQQPPAFDMLKKQQKQQKKQQQQQPSPFDMLKKQQKQQKKQQQQQQQQQRKPPVSVPPPNEVHSPFAAPAFEKQGVVGYFWDMENCSVPRGANGFEIVQNIRRKVQSLVPGLQEKVFVAAGKFNMQFPQEVLAAVQRAGVRLAHSADPKRDSADWLLRDELDDFQNYHKPPGNFSITAATKCHEDNMLISFTFLAMVVLISGDSDFFRKMVMLKEQLHYTTCIIHNAAAKEEVKMAATHTIEWTSLCPTQVSKAPPPKAANSPAKSAKPAPKAGYYPPPPKSAKPPASKLHKGKDQGWREIETGEQANGWAVLPGAKKHKEKPGYPCDFCGNPFKNIDALREHQRDTSHLYRCKYCGDNSFVTLDGLSCHINDVHIDDGEATSDEDSDEEYECGFCDRSFNSIDALRQHQEDTNHLHMRALWG